MFFSVVLPQRSKPDPTQLLSALPWAEPFASPALSICRTNPQLGQWPLVTHEPHQKAKSRELFKGKGCILQQITKSRYFCLNAQKALEQSTSREERGAWVCSCYCDAELVSLPRISQMFRKRQMLHDWWVAQTSGKPQQMLRKCIWQRGNARSCHCNTAPSLPSWKEMTERFRIWVSGSWQLHVIGQGSSIFGALRTSRPRRAGLPVPWVFETQTEDTQGEQAKCRITSSVYV